ncbi:MAG: exosortase/archaeosortase family protein [Phycisphaerales bacterium]|nr:MAG: exosortase/archaeosortase family protein [Phycisphaerales bacterium]
MTGRRGWRFWDGVAVSGLVALAIFATQGVWIEIFRFAIRSEEQSHIFLALPAAAILVWARRSRLRLCKPRPWLGGPVILCLGWALAAFGYAAAYDLFRDLGVLIIALGAVLSVIGPDAIRHFAPAFGVLVFLMPIPGRIRQQISIPLQEATAASTKWFLDLFAVPVSQAGNVLAINEIEVAVAEACNGMRMVAALALVSYVFVFLVPMRAWVRVLILALSPLLALIANIIRLVPTVLMYGYTDVNTADLFHDWSGWLMLLVAWGMLMGIMGILRWLELPITPYAVSED